MMQLIKRDLIHLNIHQKAFTSELNLIQKGRVDKAIQALTNQGYVYKGVLEKPKGKEIEDWESREQTLFKSTAFGDDVDRPLLKSDGSWTYFASDIAYHLDKLERGFETLINVWGADHGGYVKRLTAGVKALSSEKTKVICLLTQMVRFVSGGEVLKMSKRSGNFVTVDEALERVGLDAMRFMMVSRKCDASLDFDFEKVIEQSKDNPVFYVQYAYARCHSIKRHIQETFPELDLSSETLSQIPLEDLELPDFLAIIKKMVHWPRTLEMAARTFEPHRVTYYLSELAAEFHALWNKGRDVRELRFIATEDEKLTQKHFALVQGVATVLKSGLNILGVRSREEM